VISRNMLAFFVVVTMVGGSTFAAIDVWTPGEVDCSKSVGCWVPDEGPGGTCKSSSHCSSSASSWLTFWTDENIDSNDGDSVTYMVKYVWDADSGDDQSCAVNFNCHVMSEGDTDATGELQAGGLGGTSSNYGKCTATCAASVHGQNFSPFNFTDVGASSSHSAGPTASGTYVPGSSDPEKYTISRGGLTGRNDNWCWSKKWTQNEQKSGSAPEGTQTIVLSATVDSKAKTKAKAMAGVIPILNASSADATATGVAEVTRLHFTAFSED